MEDFKRFFVIGGLTIELNFDTDDKYQGLIPSFKYFSTKDRHHVPDISVKVGHFYHYKKDLRNNVMKTTNGSVSIDDVNGKYRFFIRNTKGVETCVMDCNRRFTQCSCEPLGNAENRSLGLKTALLIIYIGASPYFNRILIHSSTVKKDGKAYCFMGNSGEGKSTQSALWINNIKGCSILNDDMPILQMDGDKVKVWGSPWSGKTNYYINDSAELCAMVKMSHGLTNNIKRVIGVASFKDLMSSCSCFSICKTSCSFLIKNILKILSRYPFYEMSCVPERDAALLCYNTIEIDKKKLNSTITA